MPVHDWTRVDAGVIHSFHTTWVALLGVRLNETLPSDYYAMVEGKAFGWEPDILTLGRGERGSNGAGHGPRESGSGGVLSLAAAPPEVEFTVSRPGSSKQRRLAIRRSADDRIVAAIEVVSPGNKASRQAFRDFVTKASELLSRGVNLLVIDLFPPTPWDPDGIHVVIWGSDDESSPRAGNPLTLVAYRAGDEEQANVRSVAVGDRLPDMPLCLEGDLYIPVPLESTYMATFGGFAARWREVLTAPATEGGANGT
jgi:hypothetical protein